MINCSIIYHVTVSVFKINHNSLYFDTRLHYPYTEYLGEKITIDETVCVGVQNRFVQSVRYGKSCLSDEFLSC